MTRPEHHFKFAINTRADSALVRRLFQADIRVVESLRNSD